METAIYSQSNANPIVLFGICIDYYNTSPQEYMIPPSPDTKDIKDDNVTILPQISHTQIILPAAAQRLV